MTILSVIQQVCPAIGLSVPATVLAATDRDSVELTALANEMAQRIAFDTHDWSRLKVLATLTGTGAASAFNFPADYQRMLKKARLWPSSSPYSSLTHYADSDEWLGIQAQNYHPFIGGWTIIGDQISIDPIVANAATVKFYYLTNLIIKDNVGTPKTLFTADTDVFRLNERVLKLGMIWQWKANKGLPYAEDMTNYEDALSSQIGADKGSNIITVGRGVFNADVRLAYPGTLG